MCSDLFNRTSYSYNLFRRFFARTFDFFIYGLFASTIIQILLGRHPDNYSSIEQFFISTFPALIIMLFLEPLLLSKLGTTAGKFIMGLSVYDSEGSKLSYGNALSRTFNVLLQGYGLFIPLVSLITMILCAKDLAQGNPLYYDKGYSYIAEEIHPLRYALLFLSEIALTFGIGSLLGMMLLSAPNDTNNITLSEFAENFNHYTNFIGMNVEMLEDGTIIDTLAQNGVVVETSSIYYFPKFEYTEQDGKLTSIGFTVDYQKGDMTVSSYFSFIQLTAFALNYQDLTFYGKDFIANTDDVIFTYEVEQTGYFYSESLDVFVVDNGFSENSDYPPIKINFLAEIK